MSAEFGLVFGLSIPIFLFFVLALKIDNVYIQLLCLMISLGFGFPLYNVILKIEENLVNQISAQNTVVAGYEMYTYVTVAIMTLTFCFYFYKLMMTLIKSAKLKKDKRGK